MHENYKYAYLKIDEIDERAKKENILINFLRITEEKVVFFPAWTFIYKNGTLTAESPYDKFSIIENNVDNLIQNAEKRAMISAIKNSDNIEKELYIYLLYRLYYNWVLNSIIFDYEEYSWKIHLSSSSEKICWDKNNNYIGFETKKYIGIFKIRPKINTMKIPLIDCEKVATKVIEICFNQDKRRRGRITSQHGAVITIEHHPEDRKLLNDLVKTERGKVAKQQMEDEYEGFAFKEHIRYECTIYYKMNDKLIIAYGDYAIKKHPYYYICSETSFEKWTFPDEKKLTPEEKQKLLLDMEEYNKKNINKTIGFVKGFTLEEIMNQYKKP